jgi:hypothetical protein
MTAENLNTAGKKIENNLHEPGTEVHCFKPPTQAQVRESGKMNKRLAFYHGPAKVVKKMCSRQCAIEWKIIQKGRGNDNPSSPTTRKASRIRSYRKIDGFNQAYDTQK